MKRIIIFIILLSITSCSRQDGPLLVEEGRIIVLMYHRIVKGEATNTYERSIADFEADLKFLKENNIKVVSFSDIEKVVRSGKIMEGNAAVISFDDGDHSWYTLVRPLLLEYKIKATFFLWTYMIGHDSFLSWYEVEQMSYYTLSGGVRPFTFGSHTYSHQYLYGQKSHFENMNEYNLFLDYELSKSKTLIEAHTPEDVTMLALPFGDGAGDPDIISAAERNGYKFIRTSILGTIDNPDVNLVEIPSLPMLNDTEPDLIGYYLNL